MAENTVSENTLTVKVSGTISIEFVGENTPVVPSTEIALRFQKKHKHVLDEIKRIQSIAPKSFTEPNFRPSEYTDSTGRVLPCYRLTRDGFSLLAMGFTGKNAIQWKLRYIEAFNTLEVAVLDNARATHRRQIEAVRDSARAEGRIEALTLYRRTTPERRALIRRALRYKGMGLSSRDSGKLMDCSRQLILNLLKDAAMLGMEAAHARV